ncbi:M48 family metalloprotease [Occallatibacter savannae]|uniref:M48 family metalloprotease n=1 Tax=Occallatibacter savannae TaxID=1002691 RepID=UPI000D69EFC3|nr:M48 family metalloprotease [Occallatibacter savannae]
MTASFHHSRAAILAAVTLALGSLAWAQSSPQPSSPTDPSAQSAPQSTPPSAQPVPPGTVPVTGDTPPTASDSSKDKKDTASADPSDCVPSADSDKKDKHKKDKKDKKDKADKDNPCPVGTEPVSGDVAATNVKVDPDKIVEVGSQKQNVKPGSIHDVSAVGNRDIGGRGMGNWYSTDTEIKMGKSYATEIEKSTRFITDPVVTEYVNRVGQNIVKNSDCKVPFTIKVIDSDEINAMALPGGFFYVNSGLILNADEEAELAGVMAHETAHVCAHHAVREQTRMNYAQLGTIPLIMMTGYSWTGYGIYEATQFAVPLTFLKFSRDFEAQADYLGIQYMYRAGYDPQAFIAFFEKVQALEKRKPGLVAKAFSDHPQTPDRILHSQEEIARILPARDEYTVTTSEFDDVKARLARIENKRRLLDTKDKNKPSLRRASTTDDRNGQAGQGKDGDDRPTLHRRDDQNQ